MNSQRLLPSLWAPPLRLRRPSRAALKSSWLIVACAGFMANAVVVASLAGVGSLLPPPPSPDQISPLAQSTLILDRDGKLLGALHDEENRVVVAFEDVPEHVRRAVLAIEDDAFYAHNGVDVGAVARAVAANLTNGGVVQGGSTITQQYVRNAFDEIGRERTIGRKIEELRAAVELERELDKDEILSRYLNTVYFGRGAYGVEVAAQTYFGTSITKVSVAQAATLAGVIHAPGRYTFDPRALRARRDQVLRRMAGLGWLEPEGYERARKERLGLRPPSKDRAVRAAYFVEYVRRQLKRPVEQGGFGLSDAQILTGGLTVHTTLDWRMQRAAERAIRTVLPHKKDPEAAIVATTTSGEIRAMVGGRDFRSTERARGFNYATQMVDGGGRQPGSAFKPFTLAAYLDDGRDPWRGYSAPSRVTVDECGIPGKPWRPANYQNQSYGSLSVVEATEKSANTVYAQMIADVGPRAAMRMARRMGITSPLEPVCSLALGTFGVTPLEMARAYATFAARGRRPEVVGVTKIVGPDGSVIARAEPRSERVLKRGVADKVNEILQRVMDRGTGTPANIPRAAAGKTGTTEEHRDVWFAGYTPHPGLSAAVWMGHAPDSEGWIRPMRRLHGREVTGGGFAGAIWKEFMLRALRDVPPQGFPDGELGSGRRYDGGSSATRRFSEKRREGGGGGDGDGGGPPPGKKEDD